MLMNNVKNCRYSACIVCIHNTGPTFVIIYNILICIQNIFVLLKCLLLILQITTSVKNPASTLQYKKQEDSEFQLSHTFIDYVNRFSLQVKHGESYTFFINGSFTVAGNIEKEFSDPKSIGT